MLEKDHVLIVAQGLEYERILAAISIHHPTKLIILRSEQDASEELRNRVNKIVDGIVTHIRSPQGQLTYPFIAQIHHNKYHIDFFNLTKAISQIDGIIETEKQAGNTITADLSSGNKIVALALYICCTLHGVQTTYCVAGKYAPGIQEPEPGEIRDLRAESISFSVTKHKELPELPLAVSNVPFPILKKVITQNGEIGSIKTLAELLKGGSVSQSDIVKVSRHVETLEGLGYAKRQRKGRKVAIKVTKKGKSIIDLANAPSFTRRKAFP
ncbi:MAG: DUF6293 family protein [Candidatus Heimdallarchaeota archaeon]